MIVACKTQTIETVFAGNLKTLTGCYGGVMSEWSKELDC